MIDVYFTYGLLIFIATVTATYFIKLKLFGHESYERVDKQGGSKLLSKNIMEMGYWMFIPLGDFCIKYKISPNQITWTSSFIGFLSALFLSVGLFGIAAVLLAVSSTMDGLDGLVARKTGQSSRAGEILDSSLDRYVDFFFLAGLVIYYRDSVSLVIIALLAILGSFMVSYSTAKAEAMQITPPRGSMKRSDRLAYLIIGGMLSSVSVAYIDSDTGYGIPMIAVILLIAIMANYSAIQRLKALTLSAETDTSKPSTTTTDQENNSITP